LEGGGSDFEVSHLKGKVEGFGGDFGMGLFCQIVNGGDGRDFGVLLLAQFEEAEGAIGLEDAEFLKRFLKSALGAGLIAGEAVEDGGCRGVGEIRDGAEGGFGLDAAEAVEVPGGVEELLENDGFDGALGSEFRGERVLQNGEFVLLVVADDEVARGESVAEGVLRDAGFAFGGARSGGMLGVGLVSVNLGE
jgi:hypothetical protein